MDLDLLSLFPQEGARIIGGIERKQSSTKVNNGGERAAMDKKTVGEEDPLYRPPPNLPVTAVFALQRYNRLKHRYNRYSRVPTAEMPRRYNRWSNR